MSRLIDNEILLRPSGRLSIYPLQHHVIWRCYKDAQACHWTAEEIKFAKDLDDWEPLDADTKRTVKGILGFFAGADFIVNEDLAENMLRVIDIPEVRCFYSFQMYIENVHGEVYSLMIENLIRDPQEKADLFNSCNTMPGVQKLYIWAQKWIKTTKEDEADTNPVLKNYEAEGAHEEVIEDLAEIWCFSKQLIAFACVEGIMFSGAFAIIFWLKERGILPGLTFSNELISRDEGMHRDFACLLFSMVANKPPENQVLQIVKESVDFTQELMVGLMDRLPGLNIQDMKRYIEFVADNLLIKLEMPKYYKVENPLEFMEKISISGLTNFFEKRVGEYGVAGFEEGHDDPIEIDENY
jgi:ribonucleotide reductase beta subunit family protein with ferritin-like domain